MLPPLNNEDYEYLKSKYGNLIFKSALRVSGDIAKDYEDYAQEIWLTILDYFPKYLKKHNKTLKEFCEDPKFNGYVKQWIWTVKNQLGIINTRKKDSIGNRIDLLRGSGEDYSHDNNLNYISFEVQSSVEEFNPIELYELKDGKDVHDRILAAIAFDLDTVKDNGGINAAAIARNTGLSVNLVNRELLKIRKEYKNAIKNI